MSSCAQPSAIALSNSIFAELNTGACRTD
jgi:hypothetical protein